MHACSYVCHNAGFFIIVVGAKQMHVQELHHIDSKEKLIQSCCRFMSVSYYTQAHGSYIPEY